MSAAGTNGAEEYEQEHVHDVYEQIAVHFSSTRYKPWPIIERFLQALPPGSVGLDVGCGNGKYLSVNPDIFIAASDRSTNLVSIANRHEPHTAVVADMLSLPHPQGSFDFAICIAAVHHLSSAERRIDAVQVILDMLKPQAQALIYVWALEQERSRRGWSERDDQDVMVPWVMRGLSKKDGAASQASDTSASPAGERVFHRYYHLYRQGELERDVRSAGGRVIDAGYEKDNWWAIASRNDV